MMKGCLGHKSWSEEASLHTASATPTGCTQLLTGCRVQPTPPLFPRRGHSFVRTNHGTTTRAAPDAERALGQGTRPELVEGTVDVALLAFAEVRLHPQRCGLNLGVQGEPAAKPTLDFGQVDPATLSIPEGVKSSLCVVLRELRRETIAMNEATPRPLSVTAAV